MSKDDYTVQPVDVAMRLRRKAFFSPPEELCEATSETSPEPQSRSKLRNIKTDGVPWYATVVRVVNRELKASGITYRNGTRTYHIAALLRDDAVSEAVGEITESSSEDDIVRITRAVVRRHIARFKKRSHQNIVPSESNDPTNGDDAGDACSIGNGVIGGSSLNAAEDYSLTASRADYGKVSRIEDTLIDRIDQQRRVRTLVQTAIAAVGIRQWRWMLDALIRRRRGARLTSTERSRLHRLKIKCNKSPSPPG